MFQEDFAKKFMFPLVKSNIWGNCKRKANITAMKSIKAFCDKNALLTIREKLCRMA